MSACANARGFSRRALSATRPGQNSFSAIERKLSAKEPGRSLTPQRKQALLLRLAYNIYKLWHPIFDFRSVPKLFNSAKPVLGSPFGSLATMAKEGLSGIVVLLVGGILGIVDIVIGRVTKEAASMLPDVADSITDLNYRYEQQT